MKPVYDAIPFITEDLAANNPNIREKETNGTKSNSLKIKPSLRKNRPNGKKDSFATQSPTKKPEETKKKIEFSIDEIPLNKRDLEIEFLFNHLKEEYPEKVKRAIPGTFCLLKISQLLHRFISFFPFLAGIYTISITYQSWTIQNTTSLLEIVFHTLIGIGLIISSIFTTRYFWSQKTNKPQAEILSKEKNDNLQHFVNEICNSLRVPAPMQIGISLNPTIEIEPLEIKTNKNRYNKTCNYSLIIGLPLLNMQSNRELAALIAYKISFHSQSNKSLWKLCKTLENLEKYVTYPDKFHCTHNNKHKLFNETKKIIFFPLNLLERGISHVFLSIFRSIILRINHPLHIYSLKNSINLCGYETTKSALDKSHAAHLNLIKMIFSNSKNIKLTNPLETILNFDLLNQQTLKATEKNWKRNIKPLKKLPDWLEVKHATEKLQHQYPAYVLFDRHEKIGKNLVKNYLLDHKIDINLAIEQSELWFNPKDNWQQIEIIQQYFNCQFRKNRVVIPDCNSDEMGSILSMKASLKDCIDQLREEFPHWSRKISEWDETLFPYVSIVKNNNKMDLIQKLHSDLAQSEDLISKRMGQAFKVFFSLNAPEKHKPALNLIQLCNMQLNALYTLDKLLLESLELKKAMNDKPDQSHPIKKYKLLVSIQDELMLKVEQFPKHQHTRYLKDCVTEMRAYKCQDTEELLKRSQQLLTLLDQAYVKAIHDLVKQCLLIEEKLKLKPIKIC